jgi:hypothetical protein
MSFSFSSTHS